MEAELIELINATFGNLPKNSKEIEKLAIENAIKIEQDIEKGMLGWVNKPKGFCRFFWSLAESIPKTHCHNIQRTSMTCS